MRLKWGRTQDIARKNNLLTIDFENTLYIIYRKEMHETERQTVQGGAAAQKSAMRQENGWK